MKFGVLGFGYHNYNAFNDHMNRFGYWAVNLGETPQSIAIRHAYRKVGIADEQMLFINRNTLPRMMAKTWS